MRTLTIKLTIQAIIVVLIAGLIASCGGQKSLTDLTARETFLLGKEKYDKGKQFSAIERFQAVIYNFPGDAVVDTAQYYLGMAYYRNDDFQLAAVEFNRLSLNYPSSAFFERAIFMKAVAYFENTPGHYGLDQSELKSAIKLFEDFLIDFPESDQIEAAREHLLIARSRMAKKFYESGVVYNRIGAYEAAKIYFQYVIDDYTDTKLAPLAAYDYGQMEFQLKNFGEARQRFDNFGVVFPDHELAPKAAVKAAEAAFKRCRKFSDEGDTLEARQCWEEFRTDYPNDKRFSKATEYLEKLQPLEPGGSKPQEEHAGN